jgi:hypothetical protein
MRIVQREAKKNPNLQHLNGTLKIPKLDFTTNTTLNK